MLLKLKSIQLVIDTLWWRTFSKRRSLSTCNLTHLCISLVGVRRCTPRIFLMLIFCRHCSSSEYLLFKPPLPHHRHRSALVWGSCKALDLILLWEVAVLWTVIWSCVWPWLIDGQYVPWNSDWITITITIYISLLTNSITHDDCTHTGYTES